MVAAEKHGKNQRREGVGDEQRGELEVERSARGLGQNDFDDSELRQENAKNHAEPRVREHCLRVVDPQLRHGGDENQEAQEEFLRRFLLDAGENQGGQAHDKRGEDDRAHRPARFQRFEKLAFLNCAATLATIAALIDQAPALKKSEHVKNYSNGQRREVQEGF